jgi:hypothetical protein
MIVRHAYTTVASLLAARQRRQGARAVRRIALVTVSITVAAGLTNTPTHAVAPDRDWRERSKSIKHCGAK